MSAMSEIATDLELNWRKVESGYRHRSESWHIVQQGEREFDLFSVLAAGPRPVWGHVLTGELHTAVHHVMQEV